MGSTAPSARRAGGPPRLLILTPDFPPAPGGIQVVAHRLATSLAGFETSVVTPAVEGAELLDSESGVPTLRVRGGGALRGGRNALLNAASLARAASLRPDVTLSAHIATSPAAAAIRKTTGARTVQYFHAEEIGAKPRLAAFAANHADLSIAVSAYTAGLVAATGATAAEPHGDRQRHGRAERCDAAAGGASDDRHDRADRGALHRVTTC